MSKQHPDTEVFKGRLLREREAITLQLATARRDMEEGVAERHDVGDTYDSVERESRTATTTALAAQSAKNLRAINEALNRIEQGKYGTCRDCSGEIAAKRLAARPFAERCLSCQERYEHQQAVDFVDNPSAFMTSFPLMDSIVDDEQAS